MKFVTALFCFLVLITTTGLCQWEQTNGPIGPTSQILKIDEHLFLNSGFGIYKSADAGQNWAPVDKGPGLDLSPYLVTYSLTEENSFLYVSTSNGILYSKDFGNSWTTLGPVNIATYHLEVVDQEIFAPFPSGGLYYSPDHGHTWEFKNPVPGESIQGIFKLNTTLWIGTTQGIYTSADNGSSWTKNPLTYQNLNLFAYADDVMIAAKDGSAHISNDHGVSWSKLSLPFTFDRFFSFIKNGNDLFVFHSYGVYHSADNGASWVNKFFRPVQTSWFNSYALLDGNDLFVSSGAGIFTSNDKGNSWQARNKGIRNGYVLDVVTTTKNLVSLEAYNALHRSVDTGISWDKVMENQIARDIYEYKDTIVYADWGAVYRSVDYGATWNTILNFGPNQPEAAFDGNKRELILSANNGVYYSKDFGTTWTKKPLEGTATPYAAVHIHGDSIVLSNPNEIKISTDFGKTWQVTTYPPIYLPADLLFTKTSLFLATYQGLFVTRDLGHSWTAVGCVPYAVTDIDLYGGKLIISTNKGIFVSEDGFNWLDSNEGFSNAWANSVKVTDEFVFFGSPGSGVWKRPTNEVFVFNGGSTMQTPSLNNNCGVLTIDNYETGIIRWYSGSTLINEGAENFPVPADGTYHVQITAGCVSVVSTPIEVANTNTEATVNFQCNTLFLTDYESGTIQWYKNNEIIADEHSPQLFINTPGDYYVELYDGCIMKKQVYTVNALNQQPEIEKMSCSTLRIADPSSNDEVLWFKNGVLIKKGPSELQIEGPGIYIATYESCSTELSEPLEIGETQPPVVYNVITPNGDEKNDYFSVEDSLVGCSVRICNRWGQLLYNNPDYHNNWSADEIPPGQYFYIVEHQCLGKFIGSVSILK